MTSSSGIIPKVEVYNGSQYNGGWNATASDTTPSDWMALTGVAVGVVVAVLGIFGNSVTIEAYRRNRKLQTSFNHLITNLCAVDLVFSVLVMPMILPLVATGEDIYPRHLCTALGYAYYWTLSSSVINLVFIAFNRYVGIVHSSKYRKIFSKDRIKWWLIAVWISAPILYLPFLIFDAFSWRQSSLRCALSTSKLGMSPLKFYQIAVNILLQLIPAITLVVLYRAILRKVKKCRKSVEHYPTPFSASPTGGDLNESTRAVGGRRRSTSRPPSPQKTFNESASGHTANNTPEKKSMSYLQVPMPTPTKGGSKNAESKEAQKRNGKHLTAMSSPDLFITAGKRDSFRNSRNKQDVSRRKSWGDNSDTTSLKSGIFRMRSEHTLNSSVRLQDITILSTIDSEPTSKTMSVDHNDHMGREDDDTVVDATSSSLNEKTTSQNSGLPNPDKQKCASQSTEDAAHQERPNVLGCEAPKEEEMVQNSSPLSPTIILEVVSNPKDVQTPRRQLRPLKRIMSIGGVKESIIRSSDNGSNFTENFNRVKRGDCEVGGGQLQQFKDKRSFTIPMRRCESSSGSQKRKGSRKRARSVGINKFPRRMMMTSSKNSTPKIVIDHATSDDARTSYTCNHDNCNISDRDEESTSSLVAAFARSNKIARYKSRESSQEECRWCQNLMRKILKNYRSSPVPVPDARDEKDDENGDKEYGESVFNGAQQEITRECADASTSVTSVKHPSSEQEAESSSLKNQNFSLSVDFAGQTSDYEERRVSVGSTGSRLYRYSIGGGDDGGGSRQDSLSCAGYEYTTTRTNYQRNPSRTNNDLGIAVKKAKLHRQKSIYTAWRRKSFLNSSVHSSTSTDSRRRQRRREAERHLAYSGLIICAAFAICVLPTSVISVLAGILKIRITATVKFAAGMLSWCHAVVNPILYGFLNPKYRLEFRRMLRDAKYCWRTCGGCCPAGQMDNAGSQISITSGIRNSKSWNPSSWWESTRRPSAIPQRL